MFPDDFGLDRCRNSATLGHLDAIVARFRSGAFDRSRSSSVLFARHLMPSEAEMRLRERLSKLGGMKLLRGTKLSGELTRLQDKLDHLRADPTAEEIWESVELARHVDRPYTLDYVERIFDDFFELHGDRGRADDPALVTGLGKLDGRTIVLIGHQKGRDIKGRATRISGWRIPEGYRKAMRAMALAGRHGFPLVTMVDTASAYPASQPSSTARAGRSRARRPRWCGCPFRPSRA